MPRKTSLGRRCYNLFSKENHKRDPCSLRKISATLQKKYPSIPIDAKLCVNCRKEISQLALLSSLYSHTDPTIEDASVINDNSLPIQHPSLKNLKLIVLMKVITPEWRFLN